MISDLPVKWISSLSEVKQLAVRLEELRCQRWAEEARYVYLAGLGIPALNRHGKLQGLGIMIPQRCIYIVTSQNLSSLHSFLHNSPIKKVVFDSRDLADCLFRQYNLTLENVMDLQIIELALRGQVNSRVALPMKAIQKDGQIAKVVLKDRLLTMTECSRHYLDDKVVGLENEILVVEYFCNHFSFLLEFGDVIFNGNRSDMMQYSDPRSTTVPHDYIYFGTISHRHSKINSGKSHRDNSKYDTHNFVYSHVVEKFPVLCVVECGLCHVTQPVDSYSNEELYSNQHVCKTCSAIRELHDKNEETSVKRMKWSCF